MKSKQAQKYRTIRPVQVLDGMQLKALESLQTAQTGYGIEPMVRGKDILFLCSESPFHEDHANRFGEQTAKKYQW